MLVSVVREIPVSRDTWLIFMSLAPRIAENLLSITRITFSFRPIAVLYWTQKGGANMSSFTDYLKRSRFVNMDNPRGDLVNDMLRDRQLPETEDMERINAYLWNRLDEEQWKDFLVVHRSFLKAQAKQ